MRAGLIEVSARLPPPVARVWPAAWIIESANQRDGLAGPSSRPLSTEADIYEMTGGLGLSPVCGSIHHGTECNVDRGHNYGCTARPAEDGNFHVFAIRFDAGASPPYAHWYLDGARFHSNGADEPVPHDVAMILNTALSQFEGAPPVTIDGNGVQHSFGWLRVWESV